MKRPMGDGARRTFRALSSRNYRVFMVAQLISLSGTWMQNLAQVWLVLEITDNGTALGLVIALQFLPVLALGPYGGVVADRFPKRRLLFITQSCAMAQALILGILTLSGVVELWMVYGMAAGLGISTAIDSPARQSFVLEMVGPDNLRNAITLNSVAVNAARVIGPALAGIIIAVVGIGVCFILNASTYMAVVIALSMMRAAELEPAPTQARVGGELRAGLAHVRRTPELLVPLMMMAIVGTLTYEFDVTLPLVAGRTFDGGAGTLALLTSAMGIGAVVGGLATASRKAPTATTLVQATVGLGLVVLVAAVSPFLWTAVLVFVFVGAAIINLLATANTLLQLGSAPEMRGRVMSLWAVAIIGTRPVGGPLIGFIGEHANPRVGLAVGGAGALAAAFLGWWLLVRGGANPVLKTR